MNSTQPSELEPWLILDQTDATAQFAVWRFAAATVEGGAAPNAAAESATDSPRQTALVMFSSRDQAQQYAQQYCTPASSVQQFSRIPLVKLLAECYRRGLRYAALDPGPTQARQLFELASVLLAAKVQLQVVRQEL